MSEAIRQAAPLEAVSADPEVKMRRSATQGKLVAALIEAKKKFTAVPKTKTATVPTKSGGQYQYQYADLADITTMCDPPLLENGLVVFQDPTIEYVKGEAAYVTVVSELRHVSDEWRSVEVRLICLNTTAQGVGSAITYARRYGIGPLLGIVTEKDDDGQVADAKPHRQEAPAPAPAKRTDALRAKLSAKTAANKDETPPHNPKTGEVAEPVVPFGRNQGTPLSQLNNRQLEAYVDIAHEKIASGDPKYKAQQEAWLMELEAEAERRREQQ